MRSRRLGERVDVDPQLAARAGLVDARLDPGLQAPAACADFQDFHGFRPAVGEGKLVGQRGAAFHFAHIEARARELYFGANSAYAQQHEHQRRRRQGEPAKA